jgi:proteasome lid subunit RPN8/RPN11
MLKHARAGVPLEVMGLMLGQFIDDYAIKVVDVFAMPQSGTSVSVESVDPAYQQGMLECLSRPTATKWLWAGITRIRASAVGYQVWILTRR